MSAVLPGAGDCVGDWIVHEAIGQGGLAAVYRCIHRHSGQPAALKVLLPAKLSPEEEERMRREYLTLSRMSHPRVVRAFDSGHSRGLPWFAMELVDGADLSVVVETWDAHPPPDRIGMAVQLFRELAEALTAVHALGIVHRDIKPANVLLDREGRVHLADFGGVKDNDSFRSNLTTVGRLVGTVAFMAPEQIGGDAITARTDLYGLGAVFYLMLTGRKPIGSDTLAGFLVRQLTEVPRPVTDIDPRIPRSVERVCMRLLEKDPSRRFASAEDAVAALDVVPPPALVGRDSVLKAVRAHIEKLGPTGGTIRIFAPPGSGRRRAAAAIAELGQALGRAIRVDVTPDVSPDMSPVGRPDGSMKLGGLGPEDALVRVVLAATSADAADLALTALDREQLRELLRDRGIHGAVAAHLARRFHAELDGQAGTAVRTLQAMVRQGWLERGSDGALRAVASVETFQGEPLPLPDDEVTLARAWLAGLPAASAQLVSAMAVLGPAPSGLLAQLMGCDDLTAEAAAERIDVDGLLSRTAEGTPPVTSFSLSPMRRQQAVYEALEASVRVGLHRRAADVLQAWYRRRPGTVAESVANHQLRAGDAVGAYPLLVGAAARARTRSGEMAARGLCERALALASVAEPQLNPREAARLRRTLHLVYGDALRALGQPLKAEDAYARALLAARAEGNQPEASRALASRGLARLMLGARDDAAMLLSEGLVGLAEGEPIWPEVVTARLRLFLDEGDVLRAQTLTDLLLQRAVEARDASAEVDALCGLAWLARIARKPARALDVLDRAQARSEDAGDRRPGLLVLCQRTELAMEEANFPLVLRLADEIDSVGDLAGVPFASELAIGFRVDVGLLRGQDVSGIARDALRALVELDCRDLAVYTPFVRAVPGELPPAFLDRLAAPDWFPAPGIGADALRSLFVALGQSVRSDRVAAARDVLLRTSDAARWLPVARARAVADAERVLRELESTESEPPVEA